MLFLILFVIQKQPLHKLILFCCFIFNVFTISYITTIHTSIYAIVTFFFIYYVSAAWTSCHLFIIKIGEKVVHCTCPLSPRICRWASFYVVWDIEHIFFQILIVTLLLLKVLLFYHFVFLCVH